ncbi:MAG: DJ-1/PfpI family protein, partial [Maribacter litoralis]|uniref:GlxA family transcriptional regulator n=1 Tax=Maribacter litoralis TaxID=2059726 RepID=UPI003298089F
MKKALFVIPPEVHLLDINGPAHIFYEAREFGAPLELHFVSLNNQIEIESSAGLYFNRLEHFSQFELTQNDILFIPGMEYKLLSDVNFMESISPFLEWVNTQNKNGADICSICSGSFLLAETGILDNNRCTTHWKYYEEFSKRFPSVELERNRLFVCSNDIHSSAGVSSGIDLSLYIIEKYFGTKMALDIAKEVVIYFRRSASDPQLSIFLQFRNHLELRIHNVQDYLMNNLADNPTNEDLADMVFMSKRNLTRLFKRTTGITVGEYLQKLRVEKAVALLSNGHKVSSVANECGLQ